MEPGLFPLKYPSFILFYPLFSPPCRSAPFIGIAWGGEGDLPVTSPGSGQEEDLAGPGSSPVPYLIPGEDLLPVFIWPMVSDLEEPRYHLPEGGPVVLSGGV